MLNKEFFKKYKLPLILIGIDILLTLIYISTRGTIKLFNLDTENNIPTVYQTVKLLALSFFLYIFAKENIKEKTSKIVKLALYSFPIAFFFLALDEIGQIHENLKPQLNHVSEVLNICDEVKFARKNTTEDEQKSALEIAREIINFQPIQIDSVEKEVKNE